MAKHTKKVGITGKYGTRYGASLRKIIKRYEIQQRSRYMCSFCGKENVKRVAGGIWKCQAKTCKKTIAGGCWTLATGPAATVRATINRLKKAQGDVDVAFVAGAWFVPTQSVSKMAKHTKKVGITGKYGTRYGASLRKIIKRYEIQQRSRYMCSFCGKENVKRVAGGIWKCQAKTCKKTIAGGCWTLATGPAATVRATINRLKKAQGDVDALSCMRAIAILAPLLLINNYRNGVAFVGPAKQLGKSAKGETSGLVIQSSSAAKAQVTLFASATVPLVPSPQETLLKLKGKAGKAGGGGGGGPTPGERLQVLSYRIAFFLAACSWAVTYTLDFLMTSGVNIIDPGMQKAALEAGDLCAGVAALAAPTGSLLVFGAALKLFGISTVACTLLGATGAAKVGSLLGPACVVLLCAREIYWFGLSSRTDAVLALLMFITVTILRGNLVLTGIGLEAGAALTGTNARDVTLLRENELQWLSRWQELELPPYTGGEKPLTPLGEDEASFAALEGRLGAVEGCLAEAREESTPSTSAPKEVSTKGEGKGKLKAACPNLHLDTKVAEDAARFARAKDSVVKGQSARRVVLTKFGRLPTTYDQNDPQVLKLLPSQWVPDIGLPLASGIGRGFFKRLKTGFKKGWRRQYVRPRFETWDVNDVPQFLLDCARQQGAEQAALVASSVGDTLARDVGWTVGSVVGAAWGLAKCLLGRSEDTAPDKGRVVVAGGYLESDKELLALEDYMREASQD
ncbi:unnamed protein product [Polarella glacialis]|uniref:60S ribosomal protein L37a n=1 Tax=Polarella glacialis TaxID=89957 RepID=A0A813LLW5_POLGL|nr:unnamed protein product [Polarella glacialis]